MTGPVLTRLLNDDSFSLSSHVGAGLLGYKVSRRPVAVIITEQHVAAVFLVGLIFQLADHSHQRARLNPLLADIVALRELDQRMHPRQLLIADGDPARVLVGLFT